jgi:suppressor of ftsI
MSGAIVIEGMERYVPEVGRLRVRVLIVHGLSVEHELIAAELKHQVELASKKCGREAEAVGKVLPCMGIVSPRIEIAPKERQFWP